LYIQQYTPKLNHLFTLSRGDHLKLLFRSAPKQCKKSFPKLDVVGDFFLNGTSE
jgi:hypothetical protein